MRIPNDPGRSPSVERGTGECAIDAGGDRRIVRPPRRWLSGPVRGLAVGAAAAFAVLGVSPAGAAASTITPGPGGCQWQPGIACPGPWPVEAALSPLPHSATQTGGCQWRSGTVCDPMPFPTVAGHIDTRAQVTHAYH